MNRHAAIRIVADPPRLLTKMESAEYCARPPKRFAAECPVAPIVFPNGDERYDRRDLDTWIDLLKTGETAKTADDIVARLA